MKDSHPSPDYQPRAQPVRVLLVDDHAMVRAGLRQLLDAAPDLQVIGEASDGDAGVRLALELKPDVIVMDLAMPGLSGAEATKVILDGNPKVRVLALSAHAEAAYARTVLGNGAAGYVLKRSAFDELVHAIRTVAAGKTYVDSALAEALLPKSHHPSSSGVIRTVTLSEREREVLRLLAQGHSVKETADQLGLSPRTLETYKARAMAKLDLTTRAEVIRYASQCGWLRYA